jgi:hypothetical protein
MWRYAEDLVDVEFTSKAQIDSGLREMNFCVENGLPLL